MLSITHTEHLTGARISGDYFDLDEINQAFYAVIGNENKYYDWEGPRQRILGVAHEIRQAIVGSRHVVMVGNGLTKEAMLHHDMAAPGKNIYYAVEVLWPELLFTVIALNDFVRLYTKEHNFPSLDVHIAAIRKFQAAVGEALLEILSREQYDRIMGILGSDATNVQDYAIQFVDLLNINFISSTKEERQKNLGTIAMKLAVQDKDYQAFKEQVIASANQTKSEIHDIALTKKYPDIEW